MINCRDLFFLQKNVDKEKYSFVNFAYNKRFNFAQSYNHSCIFGVRIPFVQELEGNYKIDCRVSDGFVDIDKSDDKLVSCLGKVIGKKLSTDKYPCRFWLIPRKGEYRAVFNRDELYTMCKNYCHFGMYYRKDISLKITRRLDDWHFYADNVDIIANTLPLSPSDTVISENFNFMVKAHTLRNIAKWLQSKEISLWFDDICGTQKTRVYATGSEPCDKHKICIFACQWKREE